MALVRACRIPGKGHFPDIAMICLVVDRKPSAAGRQAPNGSAAGRVWLAILQGRSSDSSGDSSPFGSRRMMLRSFYHVPPKTALQCPEPGSDRLMRCVGVPHRRAIRKARIPVCMVKAPQNATVGMPAKLELAGCIRRQRYADGRVGDVLFLPL